MKTLNSSQHYARDLRRYYRLPATQVSLTVVLSVIIVALFAIFALRPTVVAIVTLQRTITESRKTLQSLQSKTLGLRRAEGELELIKPKLSLLNSSIANQGADYGPITAQLEELALVSGVQLQSETLGETLLYSKNIAPFTPKKSQKIVALPVTVRVSGSYEAVGVFLRQIVRTRRVIGIESMVITKEAGSRGENITVAMSVSGHAYYLADEAQLGTVLTQKKGGK